MDRFEEISKTVSVFVRNSEFMGQVVDTICLDDAKWLLAEVERLRSENAAKDAEIERARKIENAVLDWQRIYKSKYADEQQQTESSLHLWLTITANPRPGDSGGDVASRPLGGEG